MAGRVGDSRNGNTSRRDCRKWNVTSEEGENPSTRPQKIRLFLLSAHEGPFQQRCGKDKPCFPHPQVSPTQPAIPVYA